MAPSWDGLPRRGSLFRWPAGQLPACCAGPLPSSPLMHTPLSHHPPARTFAGTVNTKMLLAGWGPIGMRLQARGATRPRMLLPRLPPSCCLPLADSTAGALRPTPRLGLAASQGPGWCCLPLSGSLPAPACRACAGCRRRAASRYRPLTGARQRRLLCRRPPCPLSGCGIRPGGAGAAVGGAGRADGGGVERVRRRGGQADSLAVGAWQASAMPVLGRPASHAACVAPSLPPLSGRIPPPPGRRVGIAAAVVLVLACPQSGHGLIIVYMLQAIGG